MIDEGLSDVPVRFINLRISFISLRLRSGVSSLRLRGRPKYGGGRPHQVGVWRLGARRDRILLCGVAAQHLVDGRIPNRPLHVLEQPHAVTGRPDRRRRGALRPRVRLVVVMADVGGPLVTHMDSL